MNTAAQAATQYGQQALIGTWAKTAKGRYARRTDEVVEKVSGGWRVVGGALFGSRAAAFASVDAAYR